MRVGIIGAGVSGLVAGYRLARAGHAVTLFERESAIGGLARTAEIGGVPVDRYFHFLCMSDAAYVGLIQELGLGDRLRWRTTTTGVFTGGAYHRFGTALSLARFTPLPARDRLRFAAAMMRARRRREWSDLDGVSAREWLVREQGERCFRVIWKPLLEQKFGEDAGDVSAAWMWARIDRLARSRRGLLARERFGYLEGGTRAFTERLRDEIEKRSGRIELGTRVERIVSEAGRVQGLFADGERAEFDAVLSTVAPGPLTRLAPELPASYRSALLGIEYHGIVCHLVLAEEPLTGDFWLNIDDTHVPFPGVITYSHLDPMKELEGAHLLYLPRYTKDIGPCSNESSRGEATEISRALERIRPGFGRRIREVRVHRDAYAQPHYSTGFAARFATTLDAATPLSGLYRADMSQTYPNDRSLVNAVAGATHAVTRLCEDAANALSREPS